MSSALLSSLPRFDSETASRRGGQLNVLKGGAPEPIPAFEMSPEDELEPLVDLAEVPVEPGPTFDEIEAMLAQLPDVLSQVEQEARAHSLQVLRSLVGRLFPELSRRFLAEEIGHHLDQLVPASAPVVEISARPPMLEQLEEIIGRNAGLAERCKLIPVSDPEETRVLVSWKKGGATFDFEGLLAACAAHLDPEQTLIEE